MDPRIREVIRRVEGPGRAVMATDPEGSILHWDPGAEELFGWKSEEVVGRDVLEVTPSDLSLAEARRILATLKDGRPWEGTFIVRAKSGARFYAEVVDHPVLDEEGRLVGIVGVSRKAAYL